jgi:hypothetical protein
MKPIPISHENEWVDPTTIEPKKISGVKLGLIIGLVIVVLFWLAVIILGTALLVLH